MQTFVTEAVDWPDGEARGLATAPADTASAGSDQEEKDGGEELFDSHVWKVVRRLSLVRRRVGGRPCFSVFCGGSFVRSFFHDLERPEPEFDSVLTGRGLFPAVALGEPTIQVLEQRLCARAGVPQELIGAIGW